MASLALVSEIFSMSWVLFFLRSQAELLAAEWNTLSGTLSLILFSNCTAQLYDKGSVLFPPSGDQAEDVNPSPSSIQSPSMDLLNDYIWVNTTGKNALERGDGCFPVRGATDLPAWCFPQLGKVSSHPAQ